MPGTIEENLEPVDHVAGVLGSVVHGVATGRNFTSMTFTKGLFQIKRLEIVLKRLGYRVHPVDSVSESVFTEIGKLLIINLKGGEIG